MLKPKVFTPNVDKRSRSQAVKTPTGMQQPKKTEIKVKKFELDPNYDSMTKKFLENPVFGDVETSELEKYLEYLADYTHYKGMKAEYDEAEQCADLQKAVQSEINGRKPQAENNDKCVEKDFERRKSDFEKQRREELSAFEVETADKLRSLSDRQEKEKSEFESQWLHENTRKYRKPSTHLLQLKRIEKTLAATGEYSNAKAVHKEVAELSSQEYEEAQKLLIKDYQKAEKQLKKKFEKEMSILIASRKHEKGLLEARIEQEEENLTKRGKVIKRRPGTNQRKQVKASLHGLPVTPTVIVDIDIDEEFLLPPIIPPNDPELQEKLRVRREEENRKRAEFQKRNAQETLERYSITTPKESVEEEVPEEKVEPQNEVYVTGNLEDDNLEVRYVNEDTQA